MSLLGDVRHAEGSAGTTEKPRNLSSNQGELRGSGGDVRWRQSSQVRAHALELAKI